MAYDPESDVAEASGAWDWRAREAQSPESAPPESTPESTPESERVLPSPRAAMAIATPAPGGYAGVRPRAGLTRAPLPYRPVVPDLSEFTSPGAKEVATYGTSDKARPEQGFFADATSLIMHGLASNGADILGAAEFAAGQLDADPSTKDWIARQRQSVEHYMTETLDNASPSVKRAMSASAMALFGGNTDARGNHVPSPGEVGWLNYFIANGLNLVPTVAMALLPASLIGKIAIKSMSVLGFATRTAAVTDAAGAVTRGALTTAASRVGQGAGMTASAGLFGTQNMGAVFNSIADELKNTPEKEMLKSPVYGELRRGGYSDEQAKAELLKQAVAPMAATAFAIGATAGAGVTGMAARGAIAPLAKGGLPSRLALGATMGGAEGGALMGGQGAGNEALEQGFKNAIGTQRGYDGSDIVARGFAAGLGGVAIGGLAGMAHPPRRRPVEGVPSDAHAALDAALNPDAGTSPPEPFGPPPPPEQFGPHPSPQGELDLSQAPPGPVGGAPQGELFRTTQEAQPPPTGLPPTEPPPTGGAPAPAPPPVAPAPPPVAPAPASAPPVDVSAYARLKKKDLIDALITHGEDPKTLKGMSPDQLRRRLASREATSTQGAPDTTVVTGDTGTPTVGERARPSGPSVVPSAEETSLPQPPAGVAGPPEAPMAGTRAALEEALARTANRPDLDTVEQQIKGDAEAQAAAPPAAPQARITPGQVQRRDGVGYNEASRRAAAENAAREAPPAEAPPAEADPLAPTVPGAPGTFTPEQKAASDARIAKLKAEAAASAKVQPPAAKVAIAAGKAAAEVKTRGRKKQPVVVIPEKSGAATGAAVEGATRGSREEFEAQRRADAERAANAERVADELAEKTNDAWREATADVIPIHPGDPTLRPAMIKAMRNLLERIPGVSGSENVMQMLSRELHAFASEHPGNLPGTNTPWSDVVGKMHYKLTGERLQGTGFAQEARTESLHQPAVRDSDAQRGSVGKEELSAREADAAHVAEPGARVREEDTTSSKPLDRTRATEEEVPPKDEVLAAREEGDLLAETETTADAEESSASLGSQLKGAVDEAKVKRTDIRSTAAQLLRRVLNKEIGPEVAAAEYGRQDAVGRQRRAGYGTFAEVVRNLIKRGEDTELAEATHQKFVKDLQEPGISPQKRGALRKAYEAENKAFSPERLDELRAVLKRIEDPVAATADAVERAATKAELRGKIDERLDPRDAAARQQGGTEGHTTPGGIDPRSSRFYKLATDHRLAANLLRWMASKSAAGETPMLHDALRLIANDPLITSEAMPLRALATRLLQTTPNLPLYSGSEAHARGYMGPKTLDGFQRGTLFGYHSLEVGANPEHIMIGHENTAMARTHMVVTLLHEGVHAATHRYLSHLEANEPWHPHLQALETIARELRQNLHKLPDLSKAERDGAGYASKNAHELISELLSNPVVQAALSTLRGSDKFRADMKFFGFEPGASRSVWGYFTHWVRKALGIETPRSASEYTMLDYAMRPVQDAVEHGAAFNRARDAQLLPRDPALRANAEPLVRASEAFDPRTREIYDRAIAYIDGGGLKAKAKAALLSTASFDRIIDRYERLAQDGDINHLRNVRTASERAGVATSRFLTKFRDKATAIVRGLHGHDDVAELMNDAGYARAALGTRDIDANKHLTTPDERAALAALQTRFDMMPREKQQLYRDARDYLDEKYAHERDALANNLVNRFIPNAADAEKAFLRHTMKSKARLETFLADPDNAEIAAGRKIIARGMAKLLHMGFVQGDYFPMRRYGDFVVKYGGAPGEPGYGVQMFEKRSQAEALRRELIDRGVEVDSVRERDDIVKQRALPQAPVIDEMLEAVRRNPGLRDHVNELETLAQRIQLQYASGQARAASRRRLVAGASKDVARAIQTDLFSSALRVGAIEHAGERDAAMRALKSHNEALGRDQGDAHTLDQVRHELQRRFDIGDTVNYSGGSAMARKVTSFGYMQSLASMSRLATETAEMHLRMGAFIGARHGMGRASLELGKALADISPKLWKLGGANTLKAIMGKPLSAVNYQFSKLAHDRLIEKGYDRSEVGAFFKHFEDTGLFDQTQAGAIKELARQGNVGTMFDRFLDVTSALSHASDESNRIAGSWAAFRAERSTGKSVAESIRFAEDTLRKAPNYSSANRPRIMTDKGIFGKFSAPIMQFKMYGFNEGWMLANLLKDSFGAHLDPAARKEAQLALFGTVVAHSVMAGALTWVADPVRYMGGIYDLATGQKPRDRMLNMRAWLARTIGPTAGELLGAGLPHALGMDFQHRMGVNNMVNIPSLNGFSAKDIAEFTGHVFLGAAGEDAGSVVTGISKMIDGRFGAGMVDMAPRFFRDPIKAIGLAAHGVTDQTGKQVLAREKISPLDLAYQAIGILPSSVSEARAGRQAIVQTRDAIKDRRSKLTERWLEAEPADRAAVMSEIRRFNADKNNLGARITVDQLMQQLQQIRKGQHTPGAFGLRLPKASARQLMEAGAFAAH